MTISVIINQGFNRLTNSERNLAAVFFSDCRYAGLRTIQELAKTAVVLLNDKWKSPSRIQTTEIISSIESGTIWVSHVTEIAIVKAIVSYLLKNTRNITCNQIKELDLVLEQTTECTS